MSFLVSRDNILCTQKSAVLANQIVILYNAPLDFKNIFWQLKALLARNDNK